MTHWRASGKELLKEREFQGVRDYGFVRVLMNDKETGYGEEMIKKRRWD